MVARVVMALTPIIFIGLMQLLSALREEDGRFEADQSIEADEGWRQGIGDCGVPGFETFGSTYDRQMRDKNGMFLVGPWEMVGSRPTALTSLATGMNPSTECEQSLFDEFQCICNPGFTDTKSNGQLVCLPCESITAQMPKDWSHGQSMDFLKQGGGCLIEQNKCEMDCTDERRRYMFDGVTQVEKETRDNEKQYLTGLVRLRVQDDAKSYLPAAAKSTIQAISKLSGRSKVDTKCDHSFGAQMGMSPFRTQPCACAGEEAKSKDCCCLECDGLSKGGTLIYYNSRAAQNVVLTEANKDRRVISLMRRPPVVPRFDNPGCRAELRPWPKYYKRCQTLCASGFDRLGAVPGQKTPEPLQQLKRYFEMQLAWLEEAWDEPTRYKASCDLAYEFNMQDDGEVMYSTRMHKKMVKYNIYKCNNRNSQSNGRWLVGQTDKNGKMQHMCWGWARTATKDCDPIKQSEVGSTCQWELLVHDDTQMANWKYGGEPMDVILACAD